MVKLLIGCTGSVATIKLPVLIQEFRNVKPDIEIRVIFTQHTKHFCKESDLPENIDVFFDEDEWSSWKGRGDPVLHIELAKWADIFLIAPLDANTLAKMANGLCDNLLTCTARAWDLSKTLVFCPAMNTKMYTHPVTAPQIAKLRSWGYVEIGVCSKTLICGDTGLGAMAEVGTIVDVMSKLREFQINI